MRKIESIWCVDKERMYLVDRSEGMRANGQYHLGSFDSNLIYQILFTKDIFEKKGNGDIWFKCDSYWLKTRRLLDSPTEALIKTRIYKKSQWGFTRLMQKHFTEHDIYELDEEETAKMKARLMLSRMGL